MRPGGIRPSFGSGGGGIASQSRFVKSPPRQTRSTPITDTACSRWSITPSIVRRSGPIAIGWSISPKRPPASAQRAELVVVEVPRRVVDGPAAAVRAEDRRAGRPLEQLGVDTARRVREVEHDAELDEPVDQLAPEAREPAAVLGRAVGERVPAVPGEARHPDAERVEDVRGPGLDAEALDALEREHQPQPLARLDAGEVGSVAHLEDAVGVLGDRAVERRHHRQRLAQRPLGLHGDVDVDRADLEADAALLEQREPRPREDVRLAEPALAVGELHEQVDVGVRDHAATISPGQMLRDREGGNPLVARRRSLQGTAQSDRGDP